MPLKSVCSPAKESAERGKNALTISQQAIRVVKNGKKQFIARRLIVSAFLPLSALLSASPVATLYESIFYYEKKMSIKIVKLANIRIYWVFTRYYESKTYGSRLPRHYLKSNVSISTTSGHSKARITYFRGM
jgi:hypothetical protein